jgi:hypothetical protein
LGNVPSSPVHLNSAAVSYVAALRVDLVVSRWYQKQLIWWGVLLNFGARAIRWSRAIHCQCSENDARSLLENWNVSDFLST